MSGSGDTQASQKLKRAPIRRQQLPEDIKGWGGTGADEEEAQSRRAVDPDWRHDPHLGLEGTGPAVEAGGGGGGVV